jgi:hypothetical protein
MSLRKFLAALAALTAALVLALPVASAGAATPATIGLTGGLFAPGSFVCRLLVSQIQFALLTGNTAWANAVSNVFVYSGCGGAAI